MIMRKGIGMILSAVLLSVLLTTTLFADTRQATVFVNGKSLQEKAIIKDNRTFVPMRVITEKLGFVVDYQSVGKKITLKNGANEIELYTGKTSARINGRQGQIEVAPFVRDNITYVPLRLISQVLQQKTDWDANNKVAMVGGLEEYKEQSNIEIFNNEIEKYTLEIPQNWDNRVLVENVDGTINVYDKPTLNKIKEYGGKVAPVFQIRVTSKPVISNGDNDDNLLLAYDKGKYIQAVFDDGMQYHKDTKDSYLKTRRDGQRIITSIQLTK